MPLRSNEKRRQISDTVKSGNKLGHSEFAGISEISRQIRGNISCEYLFFWFLINVSEKCVFGMLVYCFLAMNVTVLALTVSFPL